MAVLQATGTFTVHRPGEDPTPAGAPGHASYNSGSDVRGSDGRRGQVGRWTLLLDPSLWPVTEECTVTDQRGVRYQVHAAALRDGIDSLAHVTVDADVLTADPSSDGAVDTDGNVEQVPV